MSAAPRRITMVLGMHRSGTSLCSHLLSVMGIDMAGQIASDGSNAKGHWERPEIVAFHDTILQLFGRDWYSPDHALALPAGWWADPRVRAVRDQAIDWLDGQLQRHRRFGFKDPRAARLLPFWREVCSALELEPSYVLCLRSPAQVARSLAARDEIDAADAEYRWAVYNAHAIQDIGAAPVCVIPYEGWFTAPQDNTARLIAHLGLPWDAADPALEELVAEIADAGLRHDDHRPGASGAFCRMLHRRILQAAPSGCFGETLRETAAVFVGVEQLMRPLQQAAASVSALQARCEAAEAELAEMRAREALAAASNAVPLHRNPVDSQGIAATAMTASSKAPRYGHTRPIASSGVAPPMAQEK